MAIDQIYVSPDEVSSWQNSVKDKDLTTAPGSPDENDRYIIAGIGGDWSAGTINDIAWYIGGSWKFISPFEIMTLFIDYEDKIYQYISSLSEYSPGAAAPKDAKYLIGDTAAVAGLDNEILSKNVSLANAVLNGSFEHWHSGTSSAPTGWATYGAGTISRESTEIKLGIYSAKAVITSGAFGFNQAIHAEKGINYYKGKIVTYSCWIKCATANRANIYIFDGVGISSQVYHSGSGNWELITVTHTVNASATSVTVECDIRNGAGTAYFDGCMIVEGSAPFAYSPHIKDITGLNITSAPSVVGQNFDMALYSSSGTRRLYMCDGTDWKYTAIAT